MKQYDECNAKGITKEFRTILEKFDENLANKIDIKNDSKKKERLALVLKIYCNQEWSGVKVTGPHKNTRSTKKIAGGFH